MATMTLDTHPARTPPWLWAAAALGILWNLYGVYQYVGSFTDAGRAAMTAGMTASQAAVYLSLPTWISVAFALGVFGGLAGSVLLALRRLTARQVFAASLIGYAALFAGDAYHGVFAAIPSQLAILAVVVAIAAALAWAAHVAAKRKLLN